jgi:hypothetical protein
VKKMHSGPVCDVPSQIRRWALAKEKKLTAIISLIKFWDEILRWIKKKKLKGREKVFLCDKQLRAHGSKVWGCVGVNFFCRKIEDEWTRDRCYDFKSIFAEKMASF